MTREKAIKVFEEIKENAQNHLGTKYAAGCEGYYQDRIELAEAALKALRAYKEDENAEMAAQPITQEEAIKRLKAMKAHCERLEERLKDAEAISLALSVVRYATEDMVKGGDGL